MSGSPSFDNRWADTPIRSPRYFNYVSKFKRNGYLIALVVFAILVLAVGIFVYFKNRKENFLFEVDPATKCCGGPYMWGDKDSCTYKYCTDLKNQEHINEVCCGCKGFHGRPVHYPQNGYQGKSGRVLGVA